MPKMPPLKLHPWEMLEEEPVDFLKEQRVYIVNRKKAIPVDMKYEGRQWSYKPLLARRPEYRWRESGEGYFPSALDHIENFVQNELERFDMAKISLERQVIEGIGLLSSDMLFKLKRAVDERIAQIVQVRVSVLMAEHKLTSAERNYVSVLIAEQDLEQSTKNKSKAEKDAKLITTPTLRPRNLTVRPEKCQVIMEQIDIIRNEVRNATISAVA